MFVPSACVCRILHLCGERERLARMHTRRASLIYICPNLFILCRVIQFFTLDAHNFKGEMRQSRMRISNRTTPAADASDSCSFLRAPVRLMMGVLISVDVKKNEFAMHTAIDGRKQRPTESDHFFPSPFS
jgi:hypothetical protein